MPHYLLTGGCGFIGSHLAAALLARGDRVRILDDLSTGSRANLAPGAELVVGDVSAPATVATAMSGMDGCFHLAAIASVERGVREWLLTHRVNLSGTIAVFDAARATSETHAAGPIPVVYASSAAVYGEQETLPITEEAPKNPLSAYGADKLGCEQQAKVAGHVHGVPTMGLRFFNVYGPRQDPKSPYSGVISIFCDRLSAGAPVKVFGDGSQTRDFIYVADIVAGLLAAMQAADTSAPVLNLCTGQPTSVLELARLVAALCNAPHAPDHAPPRSGEIRHSVGAPDRARAMLGLGAPTPLREGLAATLAWLRTGRPGLAPVGQG